MKGQRDARPLAGVSAWGNEGTRQGSLEEYNQCMCMYVCIIKGDFTRMYYMMGHGKSNNDHLHVGEPRNLVATSPQSQINGHQTDIS